MDIIGMLATISSIFVPTVVNQNLMYRTAVFVKSAERQGTHLAMTVSAFTVGRARSLTG